MGICLPLKAGMGKGPSIKIGAVLKREAFCAARFMAKRVAFKMLIRSISEGCAQATAIFSAWRRISNDRLFLFLGLSCLESRIWLAAGKLSFLRRTAAMKTGPANGPRPASSTPIRRSERKVRLSLRSKSIGLLFRASKDGIGLNLRLRGIGPPASFLSRVFLRLGFWSGFGLGRSGSLRGRAIGFVEPSGFSLQVS